MQIDHIVSINQKRSTTELKGLMALRWLDPDLTWNPAEWDDIDMIYLDVEQLWKPDLIITNMVNWETYNFAKTDSTLIRVYAERSLSSDLQLFNVEWDPVVTFETWHKFDMTNYPLDTQNVKVKVESWMSVKNIGYVELRQLKDATSKWPETMVFNERLKTDNRYKIKGFNITNEPED